MKHRQNNMPPFEVQSVFWNSRTPVDARCHNTPTTTVSNGCSLGKLESAVFSKPPSSRQIGIERPDQGCIEHQSIPDYGSFEAAGQAL